VTRLRATSSRVRVNGKHRRAARITFTLTAPARVVFVVRGPAPSCAVVGRFAVRGRAGTNQLRFTGRIGRRRLTTGTYRITARTRGGAATRPVVVVVGSGPVERPVCTRREARAGAASMFEPLATAFDLGGPSPSSTRRDDAFGGVLPELKKKVRQLPKLPVGGFSESGDLPVRLIALGLLALSGLALIVYAVRYLRRPRFY
jgi:hypothetical protein